MVKLHDVMQLLDSIGTLLDTEGNCSVTQIYDVDTHTKEIEFLDGSDFTKYRITIESAD